MVVRITYQDQYGERHDLEWVADSTWTVERTVACFRERYPGTTLLACLRIYEPCTTR